MKLALFSVARQRFALGQISWLFGDAVCAIMPNSYRVNLDTQRTIASLGSTMFTTQLAGRRVDSRGYCYCDTIIFRNIQPTVPLSQAVIYMTGYDMPLAYAPFPAVPAFTEPDDFVLYPGSAYPGLFRP